MKVMIVDMTFEKREALIRRDEREDGIKEALISLVKDGLLAKDVAAQRLNVTVEELEKMLEE